MASRSITKRDGLLDGSSENICFAKNAGKRDSVRLSYGADGQTYSHSNDTYDESLRFQDPRKTTCQSIGFDRSFGLTCIVLHESLHSAAFYILVPAVFYMKDGSPLKYTDQEAVAIILVFTGVAFFLPLIGGIIGDIALGRYKAILFGTVMEFFGMVILLIYAVLVYVDNTGIGPQFSIPVATFLFVTALILIALGTGFIKANVTIFGAGQLNDTSCSAQKIQSYYRWYTFAINLGRLLAFCPISMFLVNYVPSDPTPTASHNMSITSTAVPIDEVRHKDLLAIGATILQVAFVGLGIFIFMIGKSKYKMLEPTGGHHMYYIFCFNRPDHRMSELSPYDSVHQEYRQQMNVYKRAILRLTLLMAALLSLYTIFEAVAYQKISIFMLQFEKLSQPDGMTVHLPLPFMNTFSTFVLVIYVPLLEIFSCRRKTADDVTEAEIDNKIAQWTEDCGTGNTTPAAVVHQASVAKYSKFRERRRSHLSSISSNFSVDAADTDVRRQVAEDITTTKHRRDILVRMGVGLVCAAIAVLCAGILETFRKKYDDLSVFWQVPQYIILGIGEFGEISAYEFANTESLPGLQGFTIGMFISTYGLGNFLAYFCYAWASGSIHPEDLDDIHMEYVYFGHAAFLLLVTLAFAVLARQYHLEHPCRLVEPVCPYSADKDDDKLA